MESSLPPSTGPLSGIVVLDLTRVLSGPYCTMVLADLGATVIKVEQPGTGDDSRNFIPFKDGVSAYFNTVNRGKKSIALDLKSDKDRPIFEKLLAKADVLVENFRPGVFERQGYTWAAIEKDHPALIFASISGFGQTGPYKDKGAYDLIVQAMGGMMSVTGNPGMPPIRAGTSIGDLAASMFAVTGIQSGLIQRARTGKGCRVDISMMECQIALLEMGIAHYCISGVSPKPMGARHAGASPFDAFQARDGYLTLAAGTDHLFSSLSKVLGHPEWPSDERFVDRKGRIANQDLLKPMIEEVLSAATVKEWVARFDAQGIPAGPVNDVAAVLADEQVVSRGVLAEIEGTNGLKASVTPVLMSTHAYPDKLPAAPLLDEHREVILRWAGE